MAAPGHSRATLYPAAYAARPSPAPRSRVSSLRVTIVAARPPKLRPGCFIPTQKLSPPQSTMAANLTIGPLSVSYNVCMPVEEDESPPVAEQEPCEPEDQFDEDLM
jgi:hypothetical protein